MSEGKRTKFDVVVVVRSFVRSFVCSFVRCSLFVRCSFVRSFVRSFVGFHSLLSLRSAGRGRFVRSFLPPSFVRSFVQSFGRSFVRCATHAHTHTRTPTYLQPPSFVRSSVRCCHCLPCFGESAWLRLASLGFAFALRDVFPRQAGCSNERTVCVCLCWLVSERASERRDANDRSD